MMKKYLQRLIAIMLSLSMAAVLCGNFAATAAGEPVYHSDLYFGYDPEYLNKEPGFYEYNSATAGMMSAAAADYLNSDSLKWARVQAVIGSVGLTELIPLISDAWGGTSFGYNNALDAANVEFAKNLLNVDTSVNDAFNESKRISERSREFLKAIDAYMEEVFPGQTSDQGIIDSYFSFLEKKCVYYEITSDMIDIVQGVVVDNLDALEDASDAAEAAEKVYKIVKVASIGLLIEDLRIEAIDSILSSAASNTDLYAGMSRLKSQLRNGWRSYFADNYLTPAFIKEGGELLEEALLGGVSEFVHAILEVASFVVFDCVMKIPSLDDLSKQQVLTSYALTLQKILQSKQEALKESNSVRDIVQDINDFQFFFDAYICAKNAALDASVDLVSESHLEDLQAIRSRYRSYGYDDYISAVKEMVTAIPMEQRKLRIFPSWTAELPFRFSAPSDTIQDNCLYAFGGALRGNLTVTGSGAVALEGTDALRINGDLTLQSNGSLGVPVEVSGDVVSTGNAVSMDSLTLCGSVPQEVSGSFTTGTLRFANTGPGVKVRNAITVTELLDSPAGKVTTAAPVMLADGAHLSGSFSGSISMLNGSLPDGAVIGGDLRLRDDGTLSGTNAAVSGRLILEGAGTVDGCTMTTGGLTSSQSLILQNGARLTVKGSAALGGTLVNPTELAVYGGLTLNGLTASGGLRARDDVQVSGTTALGALTLDGFFQQEVSGSSFTVGDLNVLNTSGRPLKLGQTVTVTGQYNNPATRIEGGAIRNDPSSGESEPQKDAHVWGGLNQSAPLVISGYTMTVDGPVSVPSVTLENGRLIVNGALTLTGTASSIDVASSVTVRGRMNTSSGEITLGGTLDVRDDLTLGSAKVTGGTLALGGDLSGSGEIRPEHLTLNGLIRQRISADNAHTGDLDLANTSKGGVLLEKKLYYSGAFTHGETPLFNETNLVKEAS